MSEPPVFIADGDPEWCAECSQKHSKCQCDTCDDCLWEPGGEMCSFHSDALTRSER